MDRIVVLGATSAIAQAFQRRCATEHKDLVLVGRSPSRLDALRSDLLARGANSVSVLAADLSDTSIHESVLQSVARLLPQFDTVLLAYGSMHDQKECRRSADMVVRELSTNFVSAASLLTLFATHFEAAGGGCLAAITSVAGDRGRQSNYVYGASKGGLTIFLEGLRGRLHVAGVRVITIKPGLVDTPMTAGMPKSPLFSDQNVVASLIYTTLIDRSPEVLYAPKYWRYIMAVVRAIPGWLLKRAKF